MAELSEPLSECQYTMKKKEHKKHKIPKDYIIVSFVVASLFVNALLKETINTILRIHERKKIMTDIPKGEMGELLYLLPKCTFYI